jgi:hypothetical protein
MRIFRVPKLNKDCKDIPITLTDGNGGVASMLDLNGAHIALISGQAMLEPGGGSNYKIFGGPVEELSDSSHTSDRAVKRQLMTLTFQTGTPSENRQIGLQYDAQVKAWTGVIP